jgi:hypothetical protein
MPLPNSWVDELFSRLAVSYGTAFLRQYEGIDLAAVRADWASKLHGLEQRPEAIKHALECLPDRPINALQFRDLCRCAPVYAVPQLAAPRADPAIVAQALAAVRDKPDAAMSPAQRCIANIDAIEAAGRPLTLAQKAVRESCRKVAGLSSGSAVAADAVDWDERKRLMAERVAKYQALHMVAA